MMSTTVSALGHYSSLAVRNLNFDLAVRQNHRRMVLETLKKVQRKGNPYRRAVARKKRTRKNRFANFHTE